MLIVLKQWIVIFLLLYEVNILYGEVSSEKDEEDTDIAEERDERLLLFATLDGVLTAVDQQTGNIRWKIKDSPIVQVPVDTANAVVPIFLPDPKDGSLYLLDNSNEPLKKLPFTIPQLVSSSPCRSSDGILYTGKKKDTWFKLDPLTGQKEQILGWGNQTLLCPATSKSFVYVGRAKYTIKMIDSKKPDIQSKVTFYDYAAIPMNKDDLRNYDLVHLTSASSGKLITFDRRRGHLLWECNLNSPIMRMYLLDPEGLISVPFTSMANCTITYLLTQLLERNGHLQNLNQMKLYPTIYIGEHTYGLYATTSLVDRNSITLINSENGPLLLGGPHASRKSLIYPEYPILEQRFLKDFTHEDYIFRSIPIFKNHVLFTGHYNVPRFGEETFVGPSKGLKQITDESSSQNIIFNGLKNREGLSFSKSTQTKFTLTDYYGNTTQSFVTVLYYRLKFWVYQQENILKLALIALTGCIIAMFWYLQVQVQEGSKIARISSSEIHSGLYGNLTEELPNGFVRVGKISFHPEQLLGKGCEGTFVYRGEFDNRQVAVKRLLPECFTFADREVSLLRESDVHPHVIRYYCTEQDRMFRYIALELCQATLADYVQGKWDTTTITPLEILRQATLGLAHLHSLDIVHRDIKPHNVLLSIPDNKGEVRAMISDFGLCKKLQVGKMSFSRRSGITGTDGWIAPEMLTGNRRTTNAVDLFSLGCLYYYVLSNGHHPFGDSLRCQANILKGDYSLSKLTGPEWEVNLQEPLVLALINAVPEQRPSCKAILQHPIFWNSSKILSFFQDVSDRIEKSTLEDFVLQSLEENQTKIVRTNWKLHMHNEIVFDLGKYRSYQGDSVRDLLRALRNKKHHFRELPEEVQKILGEIPDAFTHYWTKRFPLLLVHTWMTIQCLANEKAFSCYYHESHRYSLDDYKKEINLKCGDENGPILSKTSLKQSNLKLRKKRSEYSYKNLVSSGEVAEVIKEKLYKRNAIKKINRRHKVVDEPVKWVLDS